MKSQTLTVVIGHGRSVYLPLQTRQSLHNSLCAAIGGVCALMTMQRVVRSRRISLCVTLWTATA